MAVLQVNFVSQSLWRTVQVQVVLPADKRTAEGKLSGPQKYKTLYLLHGYWGNDTDWLMGTRIKRWAEEKDLAVVMPSGDNAFYVDRADARNSYGEFIGKELVEVTRRMFPLSDRREDTFIGGLSMGGFGAMRNGLKYHDTFGRIISLSGAFHHFESSPDAWSAYDESLFGAMEEAVNSDRNPEFLIRALARKKQEVPDLPLPQVYMACGVEDGLLASNRSCVKLLRESGFEVTYEEGPGAHEWDFWDTYIKKVVDWLPLE